MDRRGFLLAEETLKIVIALICISFLVYFLISLYVSQKDSKDLELAKASLQHLIDEINSEALEVEIYNPNGWIIVSWPHDYTTGYLLWKKTLNGKPNSCENLGWESCICICKDGTPDDCDEDGICLENDFEIASGSIEIKPIPLTLKINDGKISK